MSNEVAPTAAVDAVIADRPPDDGREWDAQCARCGSSVERVVCDACGGDGYTVEDDWDEGEREEDCQDCDGSGGYWRCGSTAAYCNAHPSPGRERVERGAIEWYAVGGARG